MNREHKLQALSIEYKVNFGNGNHKTSPKKKSAVKPKQTTNKLSHIIRLLALAHHLQDIINQGVVKDYADIARLSGLSRARVTQIMNLTLLAPQIQEEVLFTNSKAVFSGYLKEQALRMIIKLPVWKEQTKLWRKLQFAYH